MGDVAKRAGPPSPARDLVAVSTPSVDIANTRGWINQAFVHEQQLAHLLPDEWEPQSLYFDAKAGGELVIALRVVLPGPLGLPIGMHFDLGALQLPGDCAEGSHFTVLPEFRGRIREYRWEGMKDVIRRAGCRFVILGSLLHLEPFYRAIGFAPCAEPFHDPAVVTGQAAGAPNLVPMLCALDAG